MVAANSRFMAYSVHQLEVAVALPLRATLGAIGGEAQLDDQLAREFHRLAFAALFVPEPDQGGFVTANNDPGGRAADKAATIR